MIDKKNFKKQLGETGYVVIRNFFNQKTKKNIRDFANWYSKALIKSWEKKNNNQKVNYKDKFLYKKIINYYKYFDKPEYRRNPKKNFANSHFYKILIDPSFSKIHELIQSSKWHFSFIKNLRFKSKLLPWSISNWHCDRFTFRNFKDDNFKFLIIWLPLQKLDEKTGSGIEIVPKNIFSFKELPKNYLNLKNRNKLFYLDQFEKKFKKTFIPKVKFGDVVIFDSNVIHRTTNAKKNFPYWSMDLRFEYGTKISNETIKGGIDMSKDEKYKFVKLINSRKLKI
jgi:ectoine hydroxylase-related dioxygenase (phytanoyl-CoA dioxygenase family)